MKPTDDPEFEAHIKWIADMRPGLFLKIPARKRPTIRKVIAKFLEIGVHHSPTGMTIQMIAVYLRLTHQSFSIHYDADHSCFTISRKEPCPSQTSSKV